MTNKLMHLTSAFQQNKFVIRIVPDPSSPCEGVGTRLGGGGGGGHDH